jgi:type IV pilus assembly PilX-like protein
MTRLKSIASFSVVSVLGRLRSERGVSLLVVLMLMVIILAMAGAGMLFSSMDLRAAGNFRAGTQAFFAADTGFNAAYTRVGSDPLASVAPVSGSLPLPGGPTLTYCSGHVQNVGSDCGTPQPQPDPRVISNAPLYSLGVSNPYNSSGGAGHQFYQYQINMTGVGPLAAAREVEAQVQYGPID